MKNRLLFIGFLLSQNFLFAQTTFSCTSSGTVCPCASGVRAEYYSGYFNDVQTYFTTNSPGLTRTESVINYNVNNWGTIVPPAGGNNTNPEYFSTRFSGRIYLAAGTYTFYLTSDDACFLWLGPNALVANPTSGSAFINNGGLHSPATVASVAIFTANCLQDFKIHYGENTGDNRAILEYASTGLGITRRVVPNNVLCSCMSSYPLPVELLKFYAEYRENQIQLHWSTATEKNNDFFTLYRSADGENWEVLKQLPGAGNSLYKQNYTVTDPQPLPGLNYYYLAQTDHDGTSKRFHTIYFDLNDRENLVKVYPNPFQDKCEVVSSWPLREDMSDIHLKDALGTTHQVIMRKKDKYTVELRTSELAPGKYTLHINTPEGRIVKKLIRQ
jgi:hypothetical protein